MLYEYHFEYYHRINAWSAIIWTVQVFYDLIYVCEIYRAVYFSQQMIRRYEILYTEYFYLFAVFSTLYYHFHHPLYFTTYMLKSPAFTGLFRQTGTSLWDVFSEEREAGTEILRISVPERKDFDCKICRIPNSPPKKRRLLLAISFFVCFNL